jgi:predicted AAA+ superfamily ATPase
LLLNGARQVGKSYLLDWLGEHYYENYVHINLETSVSINEYFKGDIIPLKVIQFIEASTGQRVKPGKTLIILDEIQSSERALMSLKAFCEEAPQYAIAAAGSLLGVAINRERYSFPVGKVDEMRLFPLDFEEFLWATGKEILAGQIRESYLRMDAMPEPSHQLALECYKQYLIVGGMPAAINSFVESDSLLTPTIQQSFILNEYVADMAKYAPPATTVKIRACYNSIPMQLAKENKKFQYKVVKKGGSAFLFGESIDWLIQAGIVLKCDKIDNAYMPIAAYVDMSDFKLYLADAGLLTMKSGMARQTILSPVEADNTFMGGLVENYVAQSFAASGLPLFYWKNDNTAEVDFVLQIADQIIPVEVKKGMRTKSVSMNIFMDRYEADFGIRISQKNFGYANRVKSVPLYAVFCVR